MVIAVVEGQSPKREPRIPEITVALQLLGMVTRARFERATPSFGGWCSIQLSYRAKTRKLEESRGVCQLRLFGYFGETAI